MGTRAKHQTALVLAAATLFRRQGYASTGTNQILLESGAPRGSLYYYFPGGKEEIGAAALELAAKTVTHTLQDIAENTANIGEFVHAYANMLAQWMEESGFSDGCPIATVILETAPASEIITRAGQLAFGSWKQVIAEVLSQYHWPKQRLGATADLILSTIEGSLILCRAQQSCQPIRNAASELAQLLCSGQ